MLPWIRKNFSGKTVVSIFMVAMVFVFLAIVKAQAQAGTGDTFGLQEIDKTVDLANQDIRVIISKIIRAALGLLGIIAVALALYAGFTIMTSAGNEEKISQGKKILTNAIIGLAIIMSAFAIVQFVLSSLTKAIYGDSNETGTSAKPAFISFSGSGGLGSIIKDHYPARNQTGVARNTKIAITFFEPIDPSSVIIDTNKSCWGLDGKPTTTLNLDKCVKYAESIPAKKIVKGQPKIYFGDCLDVNKDGKIDTVMECDHLATSTIKIYKSENKDIKDLPVFEATAMVAYETSGEAEKAYTFVFKPEEFLGDSVKNVLHTVYLTGSDKPNLGIKKSDGANLFYGQFSPHYEWEFETNTVIDFSAPHVVSVYPKEGQSTPRNTVVQIYFSEPIDPIVSQGAVTSTGSSYENAIFSAEGVSGSWKITNGYSTMEFIPNLPCGTNSCGGTMYCLTVGCEPDDSDCKTAYTALVRTAELMDEGNKKSFLAQPLGFGIMDMAGNALDNGPGNKPDGIVASPHKPAVGDGGNHKLIGSQEKSPDNYWWNFTVENKIDREAPYIEKVKPGIDTEGVKGLKPVVINFSKNMMLSNLPESVKLEEYPEHVQGLGSIPISYKSSLSGGGDSMKTELNMIPGRDFGPNGLDLYYITSVSSSVMSVNMNCLYPGRGPESALENASSSPTCFVESTAQGDYVYSENCVIKKDWDANADTGCSTAADADVKKAADKINTCISQIKLKSPVQQ